MSSFVDTKKKHKTDFTLNIKNPLFWNSLNKIDDRVHLSLQKIIL